MRWTRNLLFILLLLVSMGTLALAARVKDITTIAGVRENQLIGYGLVVGLDGTGDRGGTGFTTQTIASMLRGLGITVDPAVIKVRNVAAVMVTAHLPPFARPGSRIDVVVSSIGDAKSLQGGTLLLTPLRAPDGKIYAMAQGPISIGGFAFSGNAGGGVQRNHPTVGHIAGGAIVERAVPVQFAGRDSLTLLLNEPDFTTSFRLVETINRQFGAAVAQAVDSGTVTVRIPEPYRQNVVEFVSTIENMELTPDTVARVVLDERTGTVVIGENVRISTVAIAHGNLSIEIRETQQVSQPPPLSSGQTVVTPETQIQVQEEKANLLVLPQAVTIRDLVKALNAIGVTPRDLIAIFQAIKAAGALHARLEIM
ncbi:MAG: flagellar basal body P-ring protein FlgI [Nitrospinota bacterium]|nr:MAG: flagellar basal body P-ring protein FlgI [Nitrospinota bacterium]